MRGEGSEVGRGMSGDGRPLDGRIAGRVSREGWLGSTRRPSWSAGVEGQR